MKRVTLADVAKHAEVSKSTVSQYLNKRFDYMSEKTKERIESAILDLGYQPNIVARSLKQKSTSTIGVIVANILHAFSTQVIRSIEDTCHEYDFHMIVCNADEDPEKEKRYIEMLHAKQVDGLIIIPTGGNVDLYHQMKVQNYPVVFVDRTVPDLEIPSVLLDNEKAAKLAVQHFISYGYDRIAIITTPIVQNTLTRIERINGYKKALQENGIAVNEKYIKSLKVPDIQAGLKEMLSLVSPPQAILAGNDLALFEILTFVKENQLRIPEDLAVIGIDEVSFASLYTPPLTTVAQPTVEIGTKATEILLEMIRDKESEVPSTIYRLEPELIIRESCLRNR